MTLFFDDFKEHIPPNRDLISNACDDLLNGSNYDEIKSNCSVHVKNLHDHVYRNYLDKQKDAWKRITEGKIYPVDSGEHFDELDEFFKALHNSRKARAGKVFELIIEELLKNRLGYPLEGQVTIDGAKPDFVLPSREHLQSKPLDCMLLTAKRTLRERWRQVVTEANKTYVYFLATLDEKITQKQLKQLGNHKIYVVTTSQNKGSIDHYEKTYNVISFEEFLKNYLDQHVEKWESQLLL